MSIMVTGGSGLIGSHTLRRLSETKKKVVSFSRGPPPEDIADKVEVVEGDIRYLSSIPGAIKEHGVERIIHTAAILEPASQKNPMLAFETNAIGSVNILEAARILDVKRVVYVRGANAYGHTDPDKPISEDQPTFSHPGSTSVKPLIAQIGFKYAKNYGLDFIVTILGLVYGPGKRRTFPIPPIIEDAVFRKHVKIPRGGDQKHDWVYVKDVADGLVRAAITERLRHNTFNIGSGSGRMHTLRDLVDILRRLIPDATFDIGPMSMSAEGFIQGPLDITRARSELGYEPQ